MKVVVLAGGYSPERDVSLSSGCMISNALAEKEHEVVIVDAFLGIEEPPAGLASLFKQIPDYKKCHYPIPTAPPDLEKMWLERVPDTGMFFGQNVLNISRLADVVFLALHGSAGENGQIQAAFDLLKYPLYWLRLSGLCAGYGQESDQTNLIRKWASKFILDYHSRRRQSGFGKNHQKIGIPCVLKPVRGGSSIA